MDKLISKVQFSVNAEKGKVVAYVCDCENFLADSKKVKKFKHLGFDFKIKNKFVGQATLNPDSNDAFDEGFGKSLALLRLLRSVDCAVANKLKQFDSFVRNRTIELNEAGNVTDRLKLVYIENFHYSLLQEDLLMETLK